MKTGIIRRIDDLGRVVIPKEMRTALKIEVGDALEFGIKGRSICLTKCAEVDMVEVVRCGECKYFGSEIHEGKHSCENYQLPYCLETDFCSYGERSEK